MPTFRHQHRHFGLNTLGNGNHFVRGGHFKIELDLHQFAQAFNITVLNVSAVFAQVHSNAVGAAQMGFNSRPNGVGFVGFTGLPQGGYMVNINA